MGREDRIYQEAAALWGELFREPPPKADGQAILDLILKRMPDARYNRLRGVRPSADVVLPKRA
jgi:hypothetical protein